MSAYKTLIEETRDITMFRPLFFRLDAAEDWNNYNELTNSVSGINICDSIESQLKELIKCRYPSRKLQDEDYRSLQKELLGDKNLQQYGVWVYYPWSRNMVHLLDKDEFIELRTNRNKYKITAEEQAILGTKKIGIIGLSVGQSIALTLAMERGCGELRLADFDTLDLSNINRIRSGVQNIGQKKVFIAAREIAEIDPFINVVCFEDGITNENIDAFLLEGGKLDLLVDECDSLDIKLMARIKAREQRIPVLMDTSDRGMLDVERFDLEPQRPLLHGLAEGLDPARVATMSPEEKIPIVLKLTSAGNGSMRGKASMLEIGMTISTWPQLASSVVLGGAVAADVSRRLLLGLYNDSGRYYVDIEEIVGGKEKGAQSIERPNPYQPLGLDTVKAIVQKLQPAKAVNAIVIDKEKLNAIVNAAMAAPSTGNDQPWKWYYHNATLFLFHDRFRSFSFGDYHNIASYLTFGAVLENLVLEAHRQGVEAGIRLFPQGEDSILIAAITFSNDAAAAEPHVDDSLADQIFVRTTNRNLGPRKEIEPAVLDQLKNTAESVQGAELRWLTAMPQILEVAKIIAACDRMRFMHPEGHYDFVHREMRWRPQDAEATRDGIDIHTLGLATPQLAAMQILKEYDVIDFVRRQKGGKLMEMATIGSIMPSSAIGLITMPAVSAEQYIMGGRSYERMWLAAEKAGLALHPLISPLYFFPRITQSNNNDNSLSTDNIEELKVLRERFHQLFGVREGLAEVFLFKLSCMPKSGPRALRKPLEEMLFTDY